jgi:hypothetical protein
MMSHLIIHEELPFPHDFLTFTIKVAAMTNWEEGIGGVERSQRDS